jgi:hypothetical protein
MIGEVFFRIIQIIVLRLPADALAQKRFTSSSEIMLHKPYRLSDLSGALHSALMSRQQSAPASPPAALPL